MSSPQNIKCGWTGCTHRFGSEIDMNMHVMMNHMSILEYGTFTLNRQEVKRKRSAQEALLEVVEHPLTPRAQPQHARVPPALVHVAPPMPCLQVAPRPEPIVKVEQLPVPIRAQVPLPIPELKAKPDPVFRVPELPPPKVPRIVGHHVDQERLLVERVLEKFMPAPIPIPPNLEIPVRSPWVPDAPDQGASTSNQVEEDDIIVDGEEGQEHEMQEHIDMIENAMRNATGPTKLSDVINEFLARLRPMKQLGFIRPQRSTYCVVCLKYVKSYHECNWKHTALEDRVAEMWFRRFGKDRPSGKNQLMKELEEIKEWIIEEEADGNIQEIQN